jgi:hypothetical protein
MSASTIGSHSKKIIVEMNKFNNKVTSHKRGIEMFAGIRTIKNEDDCISNDLEKYNFINNFKRGGISHCNKAGKHTTGTTGVDIASQYPASLIHSYFPTGNSYWTNDYDESKHGFYLIKDIEFKTEHKFKPVALSIEGTSLDWASDKFDTLYVDSYMLKYLIEKSGLINFNVVTGLISDKEVHSDKIFGKYVNSFYDVKKNQDALKKMKSPDYNESLRSTIKLYLNALTGKLVENPAIHFSLKFDDESKKVINGVGISKQFNEDKINDWIVAGVMVYSYSKRLLFEYIDCLPNKSSDVIHVETDGIYFSTQLLPQFEENLKNYKGDYPCCMGEDLGNLKIEKSTQKGQVSYFLGKKFYHISLDDEYLTRPRKERDSFDTNDKHNIYRVKGIPQTTIDADGNKIYLVNPDLFEDIYNNKKVTKTFSTMRKALFTESTQISTHNMSRTVQPDKKLNYTEYN